MNYTYHIYYTISYHTIHYHFIFHYTIPYDTISYLLIQYNIIFYNIILYDSMQYHTFFFTMSAQIFCKVVWWLSFFIFIFIVWSLFITLLSMDFSVGFFDYNKEHTSDVTGQQRLLTPPWHQFIPLIFVEVRVCFAPVLYFSIGLLLWNTVRYRHISLWYNTWGFFLKNL